jgi:hypothetical protein
MGDASADVTAVKGDRALFSQRDACCAALADPHMVGQIIGQSTHTVGKLSRFRR